MSTLAILLALMVGASSGGAPAPKKPEGSAPNAKKRRTSSTEEEVEEEQSHTTFDFVFKGKKYKIECSVFVVSGITTCMAHLPSTGVTPQVLIEFWTMLKSKGIHILATDSNITKDKTKTKTKEGLDARGLSAVVSKACEGASTPMPTFPAE